MVTRKQIQDLADHIARQFKPEKIILFGSYAYGKPTEDSDVDLMVVMHVKDEINKAGEIRSSAPGSFPMDILVRDPVKFKKRMAMSDWFILDIHEKGIVLYEAGNSRVGEQGRRRLRRRLPSAPQAKVA